MLAYVNTWERNNKEKAHGLSYDACLARKMGRETVFFSPIEPDCILQASARPSRCSHRRRPFEQGQQLRITA